MARLHRILCFCLIVLLVFGSSFSSFANGQATVDSSRFLVIFTRYYPRGVHLQLVRSLLVGDECSAVASLSKVQACCWRLISRPHRVGWFAEAPSDFALISLTCPTSEGLGRISPRIRGACDHHEGFGRPPPSVGGGVGARPSSALPCARVQRRVRGVYPDLLLGDPPKAPDSLRGENGWSSFSPEGNATAWQTSLLVSPTTVPRADGTGGEAAGNRSSLLFTPLLDGPPQRHAGEAANSSVVPGSPLASNLQAVSFHRPHTSLSLRREEFFRKRNGVFDDFALQDAGLSFQSFPRQRAFQFLEEVALPGTSSALPQPSSGSPPKGGSERASVVGFSGSVSAVQEANNSLFRTNVEIKKKKAPPSLCFAALASSSSGPHSAPPTATSAAHTHPARGRTHLHAAAFEEFEDDELQVAAGSSLGATASRRVLQRQPSAHGGGAGDNGASSDSLRSPQSDTTDMQSDRLHGAPSLAARSLRGRGVRVAVMDTGIRQGRDAIALSLENPPRADWPFRTVDDVTDWTDEGWTAASGDAAIGGGAAGPGGHIGAEGADVFGHGTFLAGIIASSQPECPGLAPEARLHIYRVFTSDSVSYTSWLLDAANHALAAGVHILSLSVGGPDTSDEPFTEKVRELAAAGVLVVSAIGNDGPGWGTVFAPAESLGVLGVGGATSDGLNIAPFSSRGPTLPLGGRLGLGVSPLAAQGGGRRQQRALWAARRIKPDLVAFSKLISAPALFPAVAGGEVGCRTLSGTSVAAPAVAGGAALLWQLVLDHFRDERARRFEGSPAAAAAAEVGDSPAAALAEVGGAPIPRPTFAALILQSLLVGASRLPLSSREFAEARGRPRGGSSGDGGEERDAKRGAGAMTPSVFAQGAGMMDLRASALALERSLGGLGGCCWLGSIPPAVVDERVIGASLPGHFRFIGNPSVHPPAIDFLSSAASLHLNKRVGDKAAAAAASYWSPFSDQPLSWWPLSSPSSIDRGDAQEAERAFHAIPVEANLTFIHPSAVFWRAGGEGEGERAAPPIRAPLFEVSPPDPGSSSSFPQFLSSLLSAVAPAETSGFEPPLLWRVRLDSSASAHEPAPASPFVSPPKEKRPDAIFLAPAIPRLLNNNNATRGHFVLEAGFFVSAFAHAAPSFSPVFEPSVDYQKTCGWPTLDVEVASAGDSRLDADGPTDDAGGGWQSTPVSWLSLRMTARPIIQGAAADAQKEVKTPASPLCTPAGGGGDTESPRSTESTSFLSPAPRVPLEGTLHVWVETLLSFDAISEALPFGDAAQRERLLFRLRAGQHVSAKESGSDDAKWHSGEGGAWADASVWLSLSRNGPSDSATIRVSLLRRVSIPISIFAFLHPTPRARRVLFDEAHSLSFPRGGFQVRDDLTSHMPLGPKAVRAHVAASAAEDAIAAETRQGGASFGGGSGDESVTVPPEASSPSSASLSFAASSSSPAAANSASGAAEVGGLDVTISSAPDASDPLDWRGGDALVGGNFGRLGDHLSRRWGFVFQALTEPLTCLPFRVLASFGVLAILDPEDVWAPGEVEAVSSAVYENGLSLIVGAEWWWPRHHNKRRIVSGESGAKRRSTRAGAIDDGGESLPPLQDLSTRKTWRPASPGGSNGPALDALLAPFGLRLELHGSVLTGALIVSSSLPPRDSRGVLLPAAAAVAGRKPGKGARRKSGQLSQRRHPLLRSGRSGSPGGESGAAAVESIESRRGRLFSASGVAFERRTSTIPFWGGVAIAVSGNFSLLQTPPPKLQPSTFGRGRVRTFVRGTSFVPPFKTLHDHSGLLLDRLASDARSRTPGRRASPSLVLSHANLPPSILAFLHTSSTAPPLSPGADPVVEGEKGGGRVVVFGDTACMDDSYSLPLDDENNNDASSTPHAASDLPHFCASLLDTMFLFAADAVPPPADLLGPRSRRMVHKRFEAQRQQHTAPKVLANPSEAGGGSERDDETIDVEASSSLGGEDRFHFGSRMCLAPFAGHTDAQSWCDLWQGSSSYARATSR